MQGTTTYEVIIIGGSFAGLAAAMALGRSLRRVLVIDGAMPCNRFSPQAHNFISRDGMPPGTIAAIAKEEVLRYDTVSWQQDMVTAVSGSNGGFKVSTRSGSTFTAAKLLLATGLKDVMPDIPGFEACWGVSILHCPYCHGYEKRGQVTGILGKGNIIFEFAKMIRQWTPELQIFSNGPSELSEEQKALLATKGIGVDERIIREIVHEHGEIRQISFGEGERSALQALYAKIPWQQQSELPAQLGFTFTEEGLIQTDMFKCTNVEGIYAAGDNSSPFRAIGSAVAAGSIAGAMMNLALAQESFSMV